MKSPDFDELNRSLEAADCEMDAAEVHGQLCGLISSGGKVDHTRWLSDVIPDWDVSNVLHKELATHLSMMHVVTLKNLNDAALRFYLFLPDDSSALSIRLAALAKWCEGFLFGLGGGINEKILNEHPQIREAISDIQHISQVGDEDRGEDAENDYFEVTEYIRLAVLMIYDTLQPVKQGSIEIQ